MNWSKSVAVVCLASRYGVDAFSRGMPRAAFSTTTTSTALHASSTPPPPPPPTQFILQYDYIPDVLEKRGPFRQEHLQLANDLAAAGTCTLGGPYADSVGGTPTGALFVFTDLATAQEFVQKDPYVSGGIVTAHKIYAWTVAVSAK